MKINNQKLMFIEELAKYGLVNQFIKTKLLEKRLKKIYLTEDEFSEVKIEYMKINRNWCPGQPGRGHLTSQHRAG